MDKKNQLIKIARLYYLEEMNQKDIAKKMNISLASVSRSIHRAKEMGLVTITVQESSEKLEDVEIAIEKKFKLQECLLTPSADSLKVIYSGMAKQLNMLFDRILNSKSIVGVSWGDTLRVMAESMQPTEQPCLGVVPIIGAIGEIETGIFPNRIAKIYSKKLHCHSYLVNTPGLVDSIETKELVTADTSFSKINTIWKKVSIILFSISSLRKATSLSGGDIFTKRQWNEVEKAGASLTTNFNFLDKSGVEVETKLSERIINLRYSEMKKKEHRILVSSGKDKLQPILSALKGGLPTVLITDIKTAKSLLNKV